MRFTPKTWSLLSLLLFIAAIFFWLKGNEVRDRHRKTPPALQETNMTGRLNLLTTQSAGVQMTYLSTGGAVPNKPAASHSSDPLPHPYHLKNSSKSVDELVQDDRAILLVNASIDTLSKGELAIPQHLRAKNASSFIVQSKGPISTAFRKVLAEGGAEVVAYVPNNAYLVKAKEVGALEASELVQAVIPFEPYYKLDRRLIGLAVNQEVLPEGTFLRITVFPGDGEIAANELQTHIEAVVATEDSPFGPQFIVKPLPGSLPELAKMSSVQAIEVDLPRMPASDITRVILGVSVDSAASTNWLNLSGSNIWVNVNDSSIDTNHPALDGRVFAGHPDVATDDPEGHGTFVAGLIIGDGDNAPAADQVQGSATNASFRGIAHNAKLFALPTRSGPRTHRQILDSYLIETAAQTNYLTLKRTNSLISNNSWTYTGATDYDSSAARFDAATRDAVGGLTGDQPVLFVFAAGNGGFGNDEGRGGISGSIYSPGTAKNVLTVGALEHPRFITNFYVIEEYETNGTTVTTNFMTNFPFLDITDSYDQVASFSSRGNVSAGLEGTSGRFKPDVVAPGTMLVSARSRSWDLTNFVVVTNEPGKTFQQLNDQIGTEYRYDSGSTYAAATISGTLALIQEFFETQAPQELRGPLSPALMKAMVINGARSLTALYDLNPRSLINYQGWGLPNLQRILPLNLATNTTGNALDKWTMRLIDQHPTNALATGQSRTWTFNLGTNSAFYPLRFTLVWTDPPGNPAVGVKLVNDLDLVVTNLDSGFVWYGNFIPAGSDFNRAVDPRLPANTNSFDLLTDRINNVENVIIRQPRDFGQRFSVTVHARRVNVNAVPNYRETTTGMNLGRATDGRTNLDLSSLDVVQDFALVISSDFAEDEFPEDEPRIFENFQAEQILAEQRHVLRVLTNGLPVLNERVGANASLVSTNGVTNQWNFYVFENRDIPNSFVTTRAGSNVAFVTFNPPNLSRPRTVEADLDIYVSRDRRLTNLEPNVLASALKSVGREGTETITLTNAAIGDVFYIGVKAEDQQGAEFSLIALSSDLPFEEETERGKRLQAIPLTGVVPDGSPLQPQANTMIAIGLSQSRILNTVVSNVITHENIGDLVGILRHGQTEVVLNNHTLNDGNFRGTNIIMVYDDSPYAVLPRPPLERGSDGPGKLTDFAGQKMNGAWLFHMIDNAPGHTGRVENLTLYIEPMQETLLAGTVIQGSVSNRFAVYPIDVPPGAVNMKIRVFDLDGVVTAYLNRGALPTTNNFVFRTNNVPLQTGFEINYGVSNQPPLSAGTWYLGLRNSDTKPVVNFKILLLFEYDFNSDNTLDLDRGGFNVADDALTNDVVTILDDKLVSSVEVSVRTDHPRISDLTMHLVSPQGTRILLTERRGRQDSNGFGSNWGEEDSARTNLAYLRFTENPNLAMLPMKFLRPPFGDNSTNIGKVMRFGFEDDTNGNYTAGQTTPDGWLVISNRVAVANQPYLSYQGTNFLMLANGGVSRLVSTEVGRSYRLRFAYRAGRELDIFSTGLNEDRSLVPLEEVDQHYFITQSADSNAPGFFTFVGNPGSAHGPGWIPNSNLSQWLTLHPSQNAHPAGVYVFRHQFTLFTRNFGLLSGSVAADNSVGIRLNGAPLTFSSGALGQMTQFSITTNFVPGLNTMDFVVTNLTGSFPTSAMGLRTQLSSRATTNGLNVASSAYGQVVVEGGVTNTYAAVNSWRLADIEFVARSTNTLVSFNSPEFPGLWIDSVEIIDTGTKFALPEESLALLQGESSMGDWRLEVQDLRTGATNPPPEMVRWRLHLVYSEPDSYAERLEAGRTYPAAQNIAQPAWVVPGTIYTNQVQYFYIPTCPDTTRATITLIGLTNVNALELFMDRSGLPTGDPERDDYVRVLNSTRVVSGGNTNGVVTLILTTNSPASAPLITGKRLYLAVQNRFVNETNSYTLRVDFDRAGCDLAQAAPLQNRQSYQSSLSAAYSGETEGELFIHRVESTTQPFIVEASSSSGDLQIFVSKDAPPNRENYTFTANSSTSGSERLIVTSSSSTPLQPGDYYIRVVNNSPFPVTYSVVAESGAAIAISKDAGFVDGRFTLRFNSVPGERYQIESSSNLRDWSVVADFSATSETSTYQAPADQVTARFFRVVQR